MLRFCNFRYSPMKKINSEPSSFSKTSPLLEEKDIFSELAEKQGTTIFLGRYSMNEVIAVLRKRNFFKDAQKRKLWPLDFKLDSSEYPLQRFQIFYKKASPENLIVDLKIKKGKFKIKNKFALNFLPPQYDFLILEWLTLQNPIQDFTQEKPPLPGQNHPGLSLGKKVLDIFVYLARITKKDGLIANPAYFHNALLFSRAFHFLNPHKEAEVQVIRGSFSDVSFKNLAWIVHLNCLRRDNDKVYEWNAEEQVHPLNKKLKSYFDSKEYKKEVKESQEKLNFSIDWECYKTKLEESND